MLRVYKLGTGSLPEGIFTAYALMDGDALVDIYVASSDELAVEKATAMSDGAGLEFEPGLAAAATAHGHSVRELTADEAANRAHVAMRVFSPDLLENIRAGVMADFFEAAYVFSFAAAKDTREWQFVVDIRGTIGETSMQERLGVVVSTGPEPQMTVVSEPDLERLLEGAIAIRDLDRMKVDFKAEPAPVAAALQQPYGLTQVPWPSVLKNGTPQTVTAFTAEKLAALMGAIGRHLSAGALGMAWDPFLGGTVEVRLGVRGIAD